jgi:glucose-1-phosphate thymidylyltransferase
VKAIVLAAGYATRLYPLTRDRAKPLLEVAGRSILAHTLDTVCTLDDVDQILIVCNAKFREQFQDFVEGCSLPVPLRLVCDGSTSPDDRLGATGDLAFALREVDTDGADLLVVAGDNLLDLDLRAAREHFRRAGAPTLVVRQIDPAERALRPSPYNDIELDLEGVVLSFREKPETRRSDLAAIALYFYPPQVVSWLEQYLSAGGNPDAPGHFVAWLVGQTRVVAVPLIGRWFDVGDPDTLADARSRFAR